ncbi:hypothetical protein [Bariatricus massiliensis]|uniref:Uncharacterized protein n=1 Tax=Bariatricus massiliensis TaxID=1745713 RepID=A0ABS8DF04_9FIRM|nr:hypothetical protein [Bariatricus massiliensis]MCB7303115.1 hypothetical protein [Bariatricus massiliensis]MCB7374331.1 hypothetical protein [Bariatricus massiliensis]MCB7387001.1 hypothetical protein [Bariatricus massiliensis]MCB7411163.1 hypothetical protein [Bariatricus massiliensis]
MINNDTNLLLSMLEGHDAVEVATVLLCILILTVMVWKIKQKINQYLTSRLQHMEEEAQEKQKLFSLIEKCENRITELENRQAIDSSQSDIYIQTLKESIENLSKQVTQISQKLDSTNLELLNQKKESNETKVNELRDRLLQGYRYYTCASTNPSRTWNEMEADAFWKMFRDYENRGGNGYMHTDVEPAMRKLPITKLFDEAKE